MLCFPAYESKLLLHNSKISAIKELPMSPKLTTTWQLKYNLKDRQDASDRCLPAEIQASDFLDNTLLMNKYHDMASCTTIITSFLRILRKHEMLFRAFWKNQTKEVLDLENRSTDTKVLASPNSGVQVGARTYPQTSQLQAAPGFLKLLVLSQVAHCIQSPGIRGLNTKPTKRHEHPQRKPLVIYKISSPYHWHSSNHFWASGKSEKNYLNFKKGQKTPRTLQ